KISCILVFIGILSSACKKEPYIVEYEFEEDENQMVINKLVGTWRVISTRVNNKIKYNPENIRLFFNHCEYIESNCRGNMSTKYSSPEHFDYTVYNNGNNLNIIQSDTNQSDTSRYNILEISSYNLILEYEELGDTIKKVYRRTDG